MVPQTYPSQLNLSTGQQEMVVFFLSSVTGLERWRDYIPVKLVTFPGIEGRTDANGFIAVGALPSITGKTAFNDYVPVFIDAAATDAWAVSNSGYIPYGLSGAGTAALSLGFTSTEFLDSRITFTRASTATRFNSLGLLETVATDKPRFDYKPATKEPLGLLIEESRTNHIRNSSNVGAATGTPGTLPTNWLESSFAAGLTRAVVAAGIESGMSYIDVRVSGTTADANGYQLQMEANNFVAALVGQTWTHSAYVSLVGGTTTNITSIGMRFIEGSSPSGGYLADSQSTFALSGGSLAAKRFSHTRTLTDPLVAFVRPSIFVLIASGVAVDFTLRIAADQVEQGAFPTSPIPTTTVAVTRAADNAVMTGTNFSSWYNATQGTFVVDATWDSPPDAANTQMALQVDNTTSAERLYLRRTTVTGLTDISSAVASVFQALVQPSPNTIATGVLQKAGVAYSAAASGTSLNTSSVGVTGAKSVPTVTQMSIGTALGSQSLNGHVRKIRYYPTKLSDASLASLTA